MARCDDLAAQLTGLQNQLTGLQSQLSDLEYQRTHPNETCADQGLTGIECELYLRGLGPQIRSTESQISGVQGQIAGVQQQQQVQWCSPVLGSDGIPLTITADDQGNVTAAQAVGTDGVKRSFTRTLGFTKNSQGLYVATTRQEFFENDVRYFYETISTLQDARKLSYSASGGGKSYGFSINFPSDGSQTRIPITIVSGVMGQPFTVTTGTLYLNQGSLAAPSYKADFALPPEIQQQTSKTAYFQSVFDQESVRFAQTQAAIQQAVGIDTSMTLNAFITTLNAVTQGNLDAERRGSQLKGAVLGLVATGIALSGGTALAPAVAIGLITYLGQRQVDIIDWWVKQQLQQQLQLPNPAPPDPTPPDPSVPIDGGGPWDGGTPQDGGESGGDPGGQCIGPTVTSEQRVIGPLDDFVCLYWAERYQRIGAPHA